MQKMILILMILLLPAAAVYGETLTLSTYYPSPFGSYDRLRLVPRGTAPNCPVDGSLEGLLYIDNNGQLKVCQVDGTWIVSSPWRHNPVTDNVYLSDDDRNIDGTKSFLGLGTSNPADRIDLADSYGNIRIYDGNSTAHVFGDEASGESDGIILRTLVNPASGEPIFAVESSGLSQRLRVEHGGALKTSNYLEVDGAGSSYIRGDLSVGATTPPQNTLDVFGEAVVGTGYAGTNANTAPTNGLLVEGNVGIGVSAPGAKLDVNGDVKINSRIDFDGGGYIYDNGTQLILGH